MSASVVVVALLCFASVTALVIVVVVAVGYRRSRAPVASPHWRLTPPVHYQCRSTVVLTPRSRLTTLELIRTDAGPHAQLLARVRILWRGLWVERDGVHEVTTTPLDLPLIDALQDNAEFWAACFVEHRPGGVYVFEVKA